MKKNISTPRVDDNLENRVTQKATTDQTSASLDEERSLQENSISTDVLKTTAETKDGTKEEYDIMKPRRIIIRARRDNGKES
jgi:hypothetical protein